MSKRVLLAVAAIFVSTAVLAADKAKQPTLADKTASKPASKAHAVDAGSADAGTVAAAPAKAAAAPDAGAAKPAAPKK